MSILNLFDLSGDIALCTGGSSGIGRRMAWALAQAGADVVLVGRRQGALEDACAEIAAAGRGRAAALGADLGVRDGLGTLVEAASAPFGAPTIVVNAAGINLRQPAEAVGFDSWDRTLALNLSVPFFLARACLPGMRDRGRGSIINIASLQSFRAFPDSIAYGAAKGGVAQLTRAMAEAWSRDGIRANAIAPGFFPTELTAPVFADDARSRRNAQMTAIGRNGALPDLDGATIFLASQASAYVTGQILCVDGGFTAK